MPLTMFRNLLTDREAEVAAAICAGFTPDEIARNLDIKKKTFDTHRGHVLKKLTVRNNVELLRKAVATGELTIAPELPPVTGGP